MKKYIVIFALALGVSINLNAQMAISAGGIFSPIDAKVNIVQTEAGTIYENAYQPLYGGYVSVTDNSVGPLEMMLDASYAVGNLTSSKHGDAVFADWKDSTFEPLKSFSASMLIGKVLSRPYARFRFPVFIGPCLSISNSLPAKYTALEIAARVGVEGFITDRVAVIVCANGRLGTGKIASNAKAKESAAYLTVGLLYQM